MDNEENPVQIKIMGDESKWGEVDHSDVKESRDWEFSGHLTSTTNPMDTAKVADAVNQWRTKTAVKPGESGMPVELVVTFGYLSDQSNVAQPGAARLYNIQARLQPVEGDVTLGRLKQITNEVREILK